jgi:chromosome segregation ATPase
MSKVDQDPGVKLPKPVAAKPALAAAPAGPGALPAVAAVEPGVAPILDTGISGGTDLLDATAKRDLGEVANAATDKLMKEYETAAGLNQDLARRLNGLQGEKKDIDRQLGDLKKFPKHHPLLKKTFLVREKQLKDRQAAIDAELAKLGKERDTAAQKLRDLRKDIVNDPAPVEGDGQNDPRFKEVEDLVANRIDLTAKVKGDEAALAEAERKLKALGKHPRGRFFNTAAKKALEKKVAELKERVKAGQAEKTDVEKRLGAAEADILTNPEHFLPPKKDGGIGDTLKEVDKIDGQIKEDLAKKAEDEEKLADLEGKRKELGDKIADVEKQIADLEAQGGALTAEKAQALADLKGTREALKADQAQIEALQAEKGKLVAEQNGLSDERRDLIADTSAHKAEYDFLKSLPPDQLSQLDKKFIAEYEGKLGRIEQIGEIIKADNARIAEIDTKIGELTEAVKTKTGQIGELEKKVKDLDTKISANEAAIKLARTSLENAKLMLGLVDKQIDKLKGDIGKLDKEIGDLKGQRDALLDKAIGKEDKEIAADKAAIDKIQGRIDELTKKKEGKQAELEKLIAERDGHLKKIEELQAKIADLQNATGDLRAEKGKLQDEIKALKAEVAADLAKIKDLAAEKAGLIAKQNNLSEQRIKLLGERDKVLTKDQYAFLKGLPADQLSPADKAKIAEYDGITEKIDGIGEKIAALNTRKGEIDAETAKLNDEVAAGNAKVAEDEKAIAGLDEKIAANQKEIMALRQSIRTERNAIADLDGKISAVKIAIARIIGHVANLEARKEQWVKALEQDEEQKATLEKKRAEDPTLKPATVDGRRPVRTGVGG